MAHKSQRRVDQILRSLLLPSRPYSFVLMHTSLYSISFWGLFRKSTIAMDAIWNEMFHGVQRVRSLIKEQDYNATTIHIQ